MRKIHPWKGIALILCVSSAVALGDTPPAKRTRPELDTKDMVPVTGERLQAFLLANTLYYRQWDRRPDTVDVIAVLYRPGGVRYVNFPGVGVIQSSWSVKNDRLCEEDFRVSPQTIVCRSIFTKENVGAACDAGADYCHFRFRWTAGNPERIGP